MGLSGFLAGALLGELMDGAADVAQEGRELTAPSASLSQPYFTDIAAETGLDFVHFNGMSGELYFPEIVGSGGAFLDYDNDGDLDVYLVQGTVLGPGKTIDDAILKPANSFPTKDRLYRNELAVDSNGTTVLQFVDVTEKSGLEALGYGMGVTTGDFNNDGWADLYLTAFGSNQMWRNNGDGTFSDVTDITGTDDTRWSTSASFADFDGDGWLDLYVANYVKYSTEKNIPCIGPTSARDYCGPLSFAPESDRLFRNRGDGTFENVSGRAGILTDFGAGLGVTAADLNGDSWLDFYVANDQSANQFWLNQGNGSFSDEALLSGVALNRIGRPEASMGVSAGDFDNDGDEDLFLTHLKTETNTLYINNGRGLFEDRTFLFALAAPSVSFTSFGTGWFDFDNDGWLDLLVVNGEVRRMEAQVRQGYPLPLRQTDQLFRNQGDGRFEEVTDRGGPAFSLPAVGRGTAFGDIDNDGDLDVLVANNGSAARLLQNNVGHLTNWLGMRPLTNSPHTFAPGTRVETVFKPGHSRWRTGRTDGSYCSASDPRVVVGLAEAEEVPLARVLWPNGRLTELVDPPVNKYLNVYCVCGVSVE